LLRENLPTVAKVEVGHTYTHTHKQARTHTDAQKYGVFMKLHFPFEEMKID